eukprot:COSAG02_NODE_16072_length_1115_cov_1.591535_1_plen_232_part_00
MCRATLPDIFPVDPGPTAAEEEGGRGSTGTVPPRPFSHRLQFAVDAYVYTLTSSTCISLGCVDAAGGGTSSRRGVVPRTELWRSIIETDGRLLYAPRSEMTEQRAGTGAALYPGSDESDEEEGNDTESANEQMHRHREELRRRVLAQHAAEEERQRLAAAETALEQREQSQVAADNSSSAATATASVSEEATSGGTGEETRTNQAGGGGTGDVARGDDVDSGTQHMSEDDS